MRLSSVAGMSMVLYVAATSLMAADPARKTPPAAPQGELPRGADGRVLNLDFEKGTLDDWTARGEAFAGQPVEGDLVAKRRGDMQSEHTGKFWIGGYERRQDKAQGTLVSAPFTVTERYASFLVGGGSHSTTCVELVRRDTNRVFFRVSGTDRENLTPVVVDLDGQQGKEIFIRLVDRHTGGWGHVNFDDFRLHHERPVFAKSLVTAADIYEHAGLAPEEAARVMTLPAGFKATLFAGEPDVVQPIAMALDHRGRLWIAEAYSYPIRVPEEKAKDRILIFEDADGDGRFDKRTVFAEKLNLVSGLEVGFGGVWIGAAPQLLFIPDKNEDDKPDGPPQVLLDGWGFQDTHETLNAFNWGPDGWLYGCHGVFTHSRVGKPGTPDDQRVPLNAGIWRYHPTRHAFEVFAHGTSNPWGVDFNDHGQAFCTACVIPHLFHIIQGARYHRQAGTHFNPYTYDDIKTIARHRHWVGNQWNDGDRAKSDSLGGGHAHAGAMIYLGGSWPAKYRNQIFMNNIHGQRINLDLLSPNGSGYEGNFAPDFLLAHDRWSQIVNLRYGPDGQVYLIDWYDKNACHRREPEAHDHTNGRIFKVSYENAKPVQVDLRQKTDAELAELQLADNDWYVRHARRLLQERGAKPTMRLAEIALKHADTSRRLRGLWALHVTGGLNEDLAAALLASDRAEVRAWTIQLWMENSSDRPSQKMLERFVKLAGDDASPMVRLYLAAAAGRLPLESRWELLARLTQHSEDQQDHNLPLMYWYALEPLAEVDAERMLTLAAASKIPLLHLYTVRRIGAIGTPQSLDLLVASLGKAGDGDAQLTLLDGINQALRGRRKVAMPRSWPEVFSKLSTSKSEAVRGQAMALAVTFGDRAAFERLRKLVADSRADVSSRQQALASLLGAKDPQLVPVLQTLVADSGLAGAAIRGLALYDDADTPAVILKAYEALPQAERRDAVATLCSRAPYALALLSAIERKQVAAGDLSADLVRQLRNLKNADVDKRINEVWGAARETTADKAKLIAETKQMLSTPARQPIDVALGRAVFAKTCQQCHTLFGAGGKVGPELTGSNRANLDYLLSNVLDPSAVMAKEYMPSIILLSDGRIVTGIVREQDKNALTVVTANETLTIPRGEIDQLERSNKSMMPDDILKPLGEAQVRSLVAYLASPAQTALLATEENVKTFFNGRDLTGWQGDSALWHVENGEIVGRTEGLKRNNFLRSELMVGDFRFSCQVKLVDNAGNSGIQFRSEPIEGGLMRGYQADIGQGWWGKLYEEHGRALLWNKSGEEHVKLGDWNRYEVVAEGDHIRTYINGQLCVDLKDPDGARRGLFAVQLHSGGPTEVRFKELKLEVIKSE
jgi:putative membrane-bound dehydrogenase-like protein